jgi:hypothetical protein
LHGKNGKSTQRHIKSIRLWCANKDNEITRTVFILSLKNMQVVYMAGNPQSYSAGKRSGRRKIRQKYSSRDSWQPEVKFYLVSVFS